jgi:hypothetical protein
MPQGNKQTTLDGYQMSKHQHTTKPQTQPTIQALSYCDDNSRYTMASNMTDIINKTQWYIDMGGDFSIITKLGRKAENVS